MGLMSNEILGSDDELGGSLRTSLSQSMKSIGGKSKSYLPSCKNAKKQQSERRRDVIKSSIFSALDQSDSSSQQDYPIPVASDDDDSESASSIRKFHRRSMSLDSTPNKSTSQPKRRGKKSDVYAGSNAPPPPPPENGGGLRSNSKSPGGVVARKTPVRSTSLGAPPKLRHAKGEKKAAIERGRERSQAPSKPTATPLRRMSLSVFGGGSASSSAQNGEDSKVDGSMATRKPQRSLSMGHGRRRTNDSESSSLPNRRRESSVGPSGRQLKGKPLGNFLSDRSPKRRDDDDGDDDSDGDSVGTEQSWISWAASSALKPLEKLYDDLNGVSDDKRKTKTVAQDDSSEDESDQDEFPNTEAEACSTRLSTTDKIAGLRFVASKQKRRSLYV